MKPRISTIDFFGLSVVIAMTTFPSICQAETGNLYLECEILEINKLKNDDADINHRIYEFTDTTMAEWREEEGRFSRRLGVGDKQPTLDISPLKIVWTHPPITEYAPGTPLPYAERVSINRQTGDYRVERPWFGQPHIDVNGQCKKIARPAVPETQF